jgi:hypothetical protein
VQSRFAERFHPGRFHLQEQIITWFNNSFGPCLVLKLGDARNTLAFRLYLSIIVQILIN